MDGIGPHHPFDSTLPREPAQVVIRQMRSPGIVPEEIAFLPFRVKGAAQANSLSSLTMSDGTRWFRPLSGWSLRGREEDFMIALGLKSATERPKQSLSCWREIASPPLCHLFSE